MPRYAITIEYDGTGLSGWQKQENGPSVQAAIEEAAAAITGGRAAIAVQGAGRTDAGVHAAGQVAHFDLPDALAFEPARLPLALNAHLPQAIRVLDARQVRDDFNARFDAARKVYCYRMSTRKTAPAIMRDFVWHTGRSLDVAAMNKAAAHLTGRHDFTSFRAVQCQADSPLRTLDVLRLEAAGADELTLIAEARSFLHHQVRNITGTLVEVGRGKITPDAMKDILAASDRARAGPTAPAKGLTLMRVDYD